MADQKITDLTEATSIDGSEYAEIVQTGTNKKALTSLFTITREFNRTFVETLVFNKNEIFHEPIVLTGDLNLTVGGGGLIDEASSMRFRFTTDGTHAINFGLGFDFLYGITNGQTLDAGTYEMYLLYTNSSVVVNVPGVSSESSGTTVLSTPANFAAVADGENAIDLSWDDVANESSYLIEFSLTGTGGWSTLSTPAAGATTSTQTGLTAGDTRYYRLKAIGDGINFLDSAFTSAISGQTESGGDVTAPTFTFLPAAAATGWTVNRSATITANEPIRNTDGSEITSANVATRITLKQTNSGGANIAFTATIDGTKQIITVTPTTQYGENQLVYLAINNVEDVNGNEVTVAVSITFTTSDYTFFDGIANRLQLGNILSLFAVSDTNFWLELTINNMTLSGVRPLITKYSTSGNQRAFQLYSSGSNLYFGWVGVVTGGNSRVIEWAGALTAGEHIIVLKYDGSLDTNDGLDRAVLLIDGVIQGSKTMFNTTGPILNIASSTAQLAVGAYINSSGTPVNPNFYTQEAKDFIVRSNSGATVEINIPNLKTGTDTSGNAHNGTWV